MGLGRCDRFKIVNQAKEIEGKSPSALSRLISGWLSGDQQGPHQGRFAALADRGPSPLITLEKKTDPQAGSSAIYPRGDQAQAVCRTRAFTAPRRWHHPQCVNTSTTGQGGRQLLAQDAAVCGRPQQLDCAQGRIERKGVNVEAVVKRNAAVPVTRLARLTLPTGVGRCQPMSPTAAPVDNVRNQCDTAVEGA